MDAAADGRPTAARRTRPWAALLASTIAGLPLGSIYAFSVFLKPLETALGSARSALTFIFSLAAIGFTIGTYIAPRTYGRLSAPTGTIIFAGLAGGGIAVASLAPDALVFAVGYGILFGIGGGVVFNITQQSVNLLVRSRQGLVNGYIISLFPAGAMIAAPLCGAAIQALGVRAALAAVAATLALTGLLAAILLVLSGVRIEEAARERLVHARSAERDGAFLKLFLVFFLAASAGLMVLSQSAGIIATYGGASALALGGTTVITAAIACARIGGGWLVDRFPIPYVAASAHALALAGAALLSSGPSPEAAVAALAMIGVGYGFVSGLTAGGIAFYWPPNAYGWITGRMYVAWCLGAVCLPVLAAYLYDVTGGYAAAMLVAGGGNLVGIAIAVTLPVQGRHRAAAVS